MRHDEIFAAGFTNNARIRLVTTHVLTNRFPHVIEHTRGTREMHTGEIAMFERDIRNRHRITRQEVDYARWQSGFFQQLKHIPC